MTEYRIVKQNYLKTYNIIVGSVELCEDERLIIQKLVNNPQYEEVAGVIEEVFKCREI